MKMAYLKHTKTPQNIEELWKYFASNYRLYKICKNILIFLKI